MLYKESQQCNIYSVVTLNVWSLGITVWGDFTVVWNVPLYGHWFGFSCLSFKKELSPVWALLGNSLHRLPVARSEALKSFSEKLLKAFLVYISIYKVMVSWTAAQNRSFLAMQRGCMRLGLARMVVKGGSCPGFPGAFQGLWWMAVWSCCADEVVVLHWMNEDAVNLSCACCSASSCQTWNTLSITASFKQLDFVW